MRDITATMQTKTDPSTPAKSGRNLHDSDLLEVQLRRLVKWLRWLTVAVFLMAVALLLTLAAIFGYELDFHSHESILVAGASTGGVVMGFLFGWLARRAI